MSTLARKNYNYLNKILEQHKEIEYKIETKGHCKKCRGDYLICSPTFGNDIKKIEDIGIHVICGNCGYMMYYNHKTKRLNQF